jgi:plasmid stabilization system protein ParE
MRHRVLVTSKARLQLTSSALWWSQNRSTDQAMRWLDGFETALHSLADRPEQHALAPENSCYELPYSVRQLLYGLGGKATHRAVFEVRGDTVYVVAIRHLAQDYLAPDDL